MIEKLMLPKKVLKKYNKRGARNPGFTLLEVLVSLVLLGIGLAFSTKVFVAGKYFIKETENKNRAMEIASVNMNKYLVKSYDELKTLCESTAPSSYIFTDTEDEFASEVKLTPEYLEKKNSTLTPKENVPFVRIEVACNYSERDINGKLAQKSIRLNNIVVYPYMHIYTVAGDIDSEEALPAWHSIANSTIDMSILTESDLLVFYNITINVTDSTGLVATDLIYTRFCIIDSSNIAYKGKFYDIQTGTPITSQATISNTVSLPALPRGTYKVGVEWSKSTNRGVIKGKKINTVILQVER